MLAINLYIKTIVTAFKLDGKCITVRHCPYYEHGTQKFHKI